MLGLTGKGRGLTGFYIFIKLWVGLVMGWWIWVVFLGYKERVLGFNIKGPVWLWFKQGPIV